MKIEQYQQILKTGDIEQLLLEHQEFLSQIATFEKGGDEK